MDWCLCNNGDGAPTAVDVATGVKTSCNRGRCNHEADCAKHVGKCWDGAATSRMLAVMQKPAPSPICDSDSDKAAVLPAMSISDTVRLLHKMQTL